MAEQGSKNAKSNQRLAAYDLLRVIAAFSVVMLHCAAQFWYELPVTGTEWKITNGYDACFRFGVPIFVMISGAIFLGREQKPDWKRLFGHNIFRLLVCYFLWNAIYGIYDCFLFGFENLSIRQVLKEMLSGRYHLWFLPMLAGIYVLCPILYEWVRNAQQKTLGYFLCLFFFLQILRMTVIPYIHNNELLHILSLAEIPMVCGYVGYFILGYYLMNYKLPGWMEKVAIWGFIPSMLYNIVSSTFLSLREEVPRGEAYDCFSLGTFLMVVAIFLLCKRCAGNEAISADSVITDGKNEEGEEKTLTERKGHPRGKYASLLKELSDNTFGVYLMHLGFLDLARMNGFHVMTVPIWLGIPLMAVIAFIVCSALAAVLRRIPLLGRYIC